MWSAATCHLLERHHDARIVSRTWLGSTASAVRNRSLVSASRSPSVKAGGRTTACDISPSLPPGFALAGGGFNPREWRPRYPSYLQTNNTLTGSCLKLRPTVRRWPDLAGGEGETPWASQSSRSRVP